MIPIVVCTVGSRSLDVFLTSLRTYNPDVGYFVFEGHKGNFGEDYNEAMSAVFELHDEIIIANDDIVLTPKSYEMLLDDVRFLKPQVQKLGFVSAMSDYVREGQSISHTQSDWHIKECNLVSPLFSYISKEAFKEAKFPPTNWYSDDIMCKDLTALGYRNFISRAYVHHAGSQSIGKDVMKHLEEAKPWIKENRPEYFKEWYE
jgi:hypothetical protein